MNRRQYLNKKTGASQRAAGLCALKFDYAATATSSKLNRNRASFSMFLVRYSVRVAFRSPIQPPSQRVVFKYPQQNIFLFRSLCYTFFVKPKTKRFLIRVTGMGLAVLMYLAGVATIFHRIEHWTWPQSFYFSAVTLTTVGYGDLHPTTDLSRMVATVFVLVSVPLFFLSLGVVAEAGYMHYYETMHKNNFTREQLRKKPRKQKHRI